MTFGETTDDKDVELRNIQFSEYADVKRQQYGFQRWLLDDIEEITYLQNSLRGVMYNTEKRKYEEIPGTRLMSDEGARVLTETYIMPIVKNAKLSNFEPEEIQTIMHRTMRALTLHLNLRLEPYKINFENLGLILDLIETYLFSVLKRALYGSEQERLSDTQKSVYEERVSQQPQPTNQEPNKRSIKDWFMK